MLDEFQNISTNSPHARTRSLCFKWDTNSFMYVTNNFSYLDLAERKSGPEVIKLFFVLNSIDHEISTAHKN